MKRRHQPPTMKEQKNEENMAEEELQLNRPLNIEKTTAASIITPNFYVFPNPLLGKCNNLVLRDLLFSVFFFISWRNFGATLK